MGISASSLLDETKSKNVKGQAEASLKDFSPYYKRQFSVAHFSQVEEDLEQHKEKITQLLKQREAPKEAEVLYEESVLYFDETRKWRERYVVVRANYCLECHDSLETFLKGVPPRQKLLPTGGTVLTTEEKYMAMVDKCFPDDSSLKEDFAPPLSGMPGQFPVYLRLPYRRDSYFCFKQETKQDAFLSILSNCIRHQNQDFLKKNTCEVQAFLKAIQLYRQDQGKYDAWDMLIGSDVRVMGNLVMEQVLPSLEKELLPRLKAKKTEKKRVWFATVEAAYILAQEHLLEGLSALKEECRTTARQQEVLIHSDMDQIVESRRQLEEKVRAKVLEPAEKLCSESVKPYLGFVLEELMEPISSGFQEGRQLSETLMDNVCQGAQQGDNEKVKKGLAILARPNLLNCYQNISSLQEKLPHLQERFGFSNTTRVIHSAQIDLQQLIENGAFTFEQLLYKAVQDNPDSASSAIEKAKHRVLKQYDYDSSTVRKRIFQEALVSITLPFIKKNMAPTCKTELQSLEQFIDADNSHFIHVENVFEDILLQILEKEVTKVVKEAASLKKFNLFTDSRDLLSQSSRSSHSSPSTSTPNSPAMSLASPVSQPPSLLLANGLSSNPQQEEQQKKVNGVLQIGTDVETAKSVIVRVKLEDPKEDANHPMETPDSTDTSNQREAQEVEAAETGIQEEVPSVKVELAAEPQSTVSPEEGEGVTTDTEVALTGAPVPGPDSANEPMNTSVEGTKTAASTEEKTSCESSDIKLEAPSSVQTPEITPADLKPEEAAEPATASDLSSLDVTPRSEAKSSEEVQATQSRGDEGSTTSDILENENNLSKSPVSSDDPAEEKTNEQAAQQEAVSEDVDAGRGIEAGASVEPAEPPTSAPPSEETPSRPDAQPLDSIKEIRNLVVEVIEVKEPVQRYEGGVSEEE